MAKKQKTTSDKLNRIRAGSAPRVLDLFAGCGGLSLGFHLGGFEILGGVEMDPDAAKSHGLNFTRTLPAELRAPHCLPRDITSVEPAELLEEYGHQERPDSVVDIIVGGPPCQAFARVGRSKLREVAEHPEAYLRDPRGNLYLRYLDYVRALHPVAILMENVPDLLNYGGHNIAAEMCEVLSDLGYVCRYTLLNSVFYGVPQMRERMFLVALSSEVGEVFNFPEPTHWIKLPVGYHGTRQVALQTVKRDLFSDDDFFVDPPIPKLKSSLTSAVTAEDALADLPPITLHLEGRLKRGARRFDEGMPHNGKMRPSLYARQMREWPGFSAPVLLKDHVIRYLPRDYEIFRRMNPGDQYPEAYQHATGLFDERLAERRAVGESLKKGSAAYNALLKETVPPYDPGKFPNKWRKMERDRPARTLMAHLGKDGYSHIHYDSDQARTISVREAARLQSFPDGFVFAGTMNPAFRQIGNAVPPLMAFALACQMKKALAEVEGAEQAGAEEVDCL